MEPLEALFFERRNTFHQGILQYTVGLMQLGLGMVRGPRRLLSSARQLLAPYEACLTTVGLGAVLPHIASWLQVLPDGVVEMPAEQLRQLGVSALHLPDPPDLPRPGPSG